MTDTNTLNDFANDIEALCLGRLLKDVIRDKYSNLADTNIASIISNLEHFIADSDIREKDVEYRQMQEIEMQKLIQAIRNNNLNIAASISFLGHSK